MSLRTLLERGVSQLNFPFLLLEREDMKHILVVIFALSLAVVFPRIVLGVILTIASVFLVFVAVYTNRLRKAFRHVRFAKDDDDKDDDD